MITSNERQTEKGGSVKEVNREGRKARAPPFTILIHMNEFDEEWARVLAEAEQKARARGRGDVTEYLSLRQTNDFARTAAADWLFATFIEHAGRANRNGASIRIERREAHRFQVGNSTMVGTLLTFQLGVRSLMVEAGWPRAPRDGIVRGGGLASARIRHFGRRNADEELLLVYSEGHRPQWLVIEGGGERHPLLEERVRQHVSRLLG
jgi:hypothetical protein